ncbi:MAG: hypothetical protein HON90_18150 [Halobacteriovoraceae bacterium]|nr:hypothetical protein [Halobacteriovoraceae bacterium]
MEKTLVKKSDFLVKKYKFFINRILIYFSFLCIPVFIEKSLDLNLLIQSVMLLAYMFFMGGQWYLLGKEVDNRLKIYYRANSSIERITYRLILGKIVMLLLFNVFALFPDFVASYLFWVFFGLLGLFYSWPTRGKIIEETMMGQFGEIKFLDSFEKTILVLSGITFFISIPEIPLFQNIDALKLYFDPNLEVSSMLWSFLTFLYLPFLKFPKLFNLIWSFHFYFIGIGLFLLVFYSMLRYFFSRRLSLLGVFSIVSTWSFAKILGADYFSAVSTTAPILWIWSLMWSTHSGTYRSGLLTGLICVYLVIINPLNIFLLPIGILFTFRFFLGDKTLWYKKQWIRYNLMGVMLSVPIAFYGLLNFEFELFNNSLFYLSIFDYIYRKAFYVISPIGVLLTLIYVLNHSKLLFTYVNFDDGKLKEILFGILIYITLGILVNPSLVTGFSILWMLSFFALIPIEWIFQSISRLRSKRNLIYAMYILVCLLDSHLESRFRIIGKMFLEIESFKYFIQL